MSKDNKGWDSRCHNSNCIQAVLIGQEGGQAWHPNTSAVGYCLGACFCAWPLLIRPSTSNAIDEKTHVGDSPMVLPQGVAGRVRDEMAGAKAKDAGAL